MEKDLSYFIDEVVKLDSIWEANYYLHSMKKAPHIFMTRGDVNKYFGIFEILFLKRIAYTNDSEEQ